MFCFLHIGKPALCKLQSHTTIILLGTGYITKLSIKTNSQSNIYNYKQSVKRGAQIITCMILNLAANFKIILEWNLNDLTEF